MHNIKNSLLVIFSVVFLAGCSLSGSGISGGGTSAKSGSIWKTIDGGKTWEAKNKLDEKTNIPQLDVISMAINPNDSKNIFVGTQSGVLLRSNNGGDSWEKLNFQSTKIYGLDIDPTNGSTVYASGIWSKRGKIFKSLDSGANWKEIFTTPAEGPLVVFLTVDRNNSKVIYISTSDKQMMKSQDGGDSWQNIYDGEEPITKIVLDKKNSNLLYATTLSGDLLRSLDGGKTIENISKNFSDLTKNNPNIYAIETDFNNEGLVYAGGEAGLLLSRDAGNNWQIITSTINNSKTYPIKTIAVNSRNSNEIFYGSALATYKSIDGGINWTTSQFDGSQNIKILKYDPNDPSIVYVGLSK